MAHSVDERPRKPQGCETRRGGGHAAAGRCFIRAYWCIGLAGLGRPGPVYNVTVNVLLSFVAVAWPSCHFARPRQARLRLSDSDLNAVRDPDETSLLWRATGVSWIGGR